MSYKTSCLYAFTTLNDNVIKAEKFLEKQNLHDAIAENTIHFIVSFQRWNFFLQKTSIEHPIIIVVIVKIMDNNKQTMIGSAPKTSRKRDFKSEITPGRD